VRLLWFWDRRGLGTVRLFRDEELTTLVDGRLGRDALEMTFDDWRQALEKTRRPIKVALLDQRLSAGIGNLYASEILHLAGIHPQAPAASISAARVRKLHAAVQSVLHDAILHEGSTLSDGTYRNALNQDGNYQNSHRVYDRADQGCRSCASPIRRIVQAQRSTFYCPRCQR
jgi:formamidopyrimidine-DNA glycosylase